MIPPCLCRNLSASLSADRQAKDRQAADRKEQPEMGSMPIEFAKTALAPAALPHTMSRSCAINVGGAVASRALLGLQTAICDRSVKRKSRSGSTIGFYRCGEIQLPRHRGHGASAAETLGIELCQIHKGALPIRSRIGYDRSCYGNENGIHLTGLGWRSVLSGPATCARPSVRSTGSTVPEC